MAREDEELVCGMFRARRGIAHEGSSACTGGSKGWRGWRGWRGWNLRRVPHTRVGAQFMLPVFSGSNDSSISRSDTTFGALQLAPTRTL